MNDDRVRNARRDTWAHAQGILGAAQQRRDLAIAYDPVTELRAARELIADVGPGQPGRPDHEAIRQEQAAILTIIDSALAGAGRATGMDPLTWAERMVQQRLAKLTL